MELFATVQSLRGDMVAFRVHGNEGTYGLAVPYESMPFLALQAGETVKLTFNKGDTPSVEIDACTAREWDSEDLESALDLADRFGSRIWKKK